MNPTQSRILTCTMSFHAIPTRPSSVLFVAYTRRRQRPPFRSPVTSHLSTVTFASFAHLTGARTTIEYIGVVANPIVLQNYNAGSMRTRYGESFLLVTCLLSYICLPHHFYMMLNEFLVLKHAHAASMASILLPIPFSIVILQASRLLSSKRLSSLQLINQHNAQPGNIDCACECRGPTADLAGRLDFWSSRSRAS